MLKYLKEETNKAFTENGALTLKTSESDCLDLFATIGAVRRETEEKILLRFMRAFAENRDVATKILFFARDVRGGLGERRVFRVILKWLAEHHPETVRKNLINVAEYGRFDDLLVLFDTPVENDMLSLLKNQLILDIEAMNKKEDVSLLAKWLPSVNTSSEDAVRMAKRIALYLNMDERTYRKTLSALRSYIRIIENNLREKDYTFDYEKQPSNAMFKYRAAFLRHDSERYLEYINRVNSGKARLNTQGLVPYEIITPILERKLDEAEKESINATWSALPDIVSGENALCVIDGSGSMYGWGRPLPASVALSLGIYFAERNTGAFKNHFITFSENPQLVEIKGKTIYDKVRYCMSYNEVANTNVQRVFELILNTAKKNKLPASALPSRLYIVSDMEFDVCTQDAKLTNFEYAKKLFEEAGYKLPKIVFWNVASRNTHQPVKKNEEGVALVSGCTPKLFSLVANREAESLTPYVLMMETLNSERYEKIVA